MNRPKFQYSLTFRRKFNLFEVYESPTTQSQFNFPQPGQQPALSILVVQRNGLRYLAETLATISAQKFKDYELTPAEIMNICQKNIFDINNCISELSLFSN